MEAVVRLVEDLTCDEINNMLCLMQEYYLNVTQKQFNNDLAEKEKVVLIHSSGVLCGFSTWMLFQHQCQGQSVNVIFSGDTITDKDHRGSLALPVAWGHLMLEVLEKYPGKDLFWLLTSKGYKTYRFLPIFFKAFYPSCINHPPDFERALLYSLGRYKFGDRFNPETCTVKAEDGAQCLRPGVADITPARLRDAHVAFFNRANPDHKRGDELVCLVRCDLANMKPFIIRQLVK